MSSGLDSAPAGEQPVVLFVVNIAWFFISHRLELARAAARRGYRVHVATGVDNPEDAELIRASGIVLHQLPIARGTAGFWTNLMFVCAVLRTIRALRPSVIHNVTLKPVIVAGLIARLMATPVVVNAVPGLGYAFSARGPRAAIRRVVVKALLSVALRNSFSTAVLQNPEDRDYLIRENVVSARGSVLIRGAGVDTTEYRPTAEPAGMVSVVMVSRMLREKGVFDFVEAARLLSSRGVAARLELVGDTDDAHGAVPRESLQEWKSSGVVSWAGHSKNVAAVLAGAHIVCLPTYYGEGVPRVLIEAASSARPIVATNVPGVREIVHEGRNGLLVPPHRPDLLADAIEQLVGDPQRRADFGLYGRALVAAEFGIRDVIAKTLELYDPNHLTGRQTRRPRDRR